MIFVHTSKEVIRLIEDYLYDINDIIQDLFEINHEDFNISHNLFYPLYSLYDSEGIISYVSKTHGGKNYIEEDFKTLNQKEYNEIQLKLLCYHKLYTLMVYDKTFLSSIESQQHIVKFLNDKFPKYKDEEKKYQQNITDQDVYEVAIPHINENEKYDLETLETILVVILPKLIDQIKETFSFEKFIYILMKTDLNLENYRIRKKSRLNTIFYNRDKMLSELIFRKILKKYKEL